MSASFWVYVNEPNNKAMVHSGDCAFCQDGRGMTAEKLLQNGRWLGPYSRDHAVAQARRAGKKSTRWCGHCARRQGLQNAELGKS